MPHSGNERPRVKDRSVRVQGGNSPRTCRSEIPLAFLYCWQCGRQLEIVAEVSSGFKQWWKWLIPAFVMTVCLLSLVPAWEVSTAGHPAAHSSPSHTDLVCSRKVWLRAKKLMSRTWKIERTTGHFLSSCFQSSPCTRWKGHIFDARTELEAAPSGCMFVTGTSSSVSHPVWFAHASFTFLLSYHQPSALFIYTD